MLAPSLTRDAEINPTSNWAPARLSKRVHYWDGRMSIITGSQGNSLPILVMKSWLSLHFGDKTNLNCSNSKLGSALVLWLALLLHSKAKASLLSSGGNLKCCHVLFPSCVCLFPRLLFCIYSMLLTSRSKPRHQTQQEVEENQFELSWLHSLELLNSWPNVCMFYSPAVWYLIQHNFKLHAVWKSVF